MDDLKDLSPEQILEIQKKNCIFCKIISGEIPAKKIYEDDYSIVILDINPAQEGHALILPKKHYQIMPQIPSQELSSLFVTAKKISHTLLKSLGLQGTTIFVANGAAAGQKAPHFMIHVIPRKQGDMLFNLSKISVSEEELENIRIKLVQRFDKGKTKSQALPPEQKQEEGTVTELLKKEPAPDNEKGEIKELTAELSGGSREPKKTNPDIDKISKLFT